MTRPSPARRSSARAAVPTGLALAAVGAVLLGGHPAAPSLASTDPAISAPVVSTPVVQEASWHAPASTHDAAPRHSATAPACPTAASLFRKLPRAPKGSGTRTLGSPTAYCSGNWAEIGVVLHPQGSASAARVQTVELFHHSARGWRWQDKAGACAAGRVPADLQLSVCDAG